MNRRKSTPRRSSRNIASSKIDCLNRILTALRYRHCRLNEHEKAIYISTLWFAACAPKFPTLTPDEFAKVIAEPDVQLVDVRTPEEFSQGHIAVAMNIDWRSEAFADDATRMLDPAKPIAIYCKAGRRSHAAAGKLYKMGYRDIVELKGGFEAWHAAGKTRMNE